MLTLAIVALLFAACEKEDITENSIDITLQFTQNWDGTPVTAADFNEFKFTNENGEVVNIERLRYVISNITIGNKTEDYHLVDISQNIGTTLTINDVDAGIVNIAFTFGFTDADNQDGVYADLNVANFNVPSMLGGGYHYMQFDGKYKDTNNQDANFNYHAIRAVDRTDPNNLVFQDTSFEVDLGRASINNNATIEIKMDISEWFKNPNTWDLNQLNTVLMPNFDAQILMNQNGKSVFSLGQITQ